MLKDEVVQSSVKSSYTKEEIKLEAVFASSPNGITVTDQNVNITECNQATLDMFGYSSKDEVIGKNALEFIAKKDQQRAMENLKKTLEQGSMANVEYTFLAKDGHEFPAELSASTIKYTSGKPIGFVAIVRDITEQKKDEKALQEAEERYRKTIVNANVGIITYGPEGEVKVLNPKMEEMTGFNITEIPTLVNWFEKLYPNEEERRKVKDKWFKRMSGEGEVKEGHAIITTKEGKRHNFLFNGVQLESGDSIAFAQDITEQKQAQQALSDSEEKFRNLAEQTPNMVFVNKKGRVVYANKKAEEIMGYTKEEFYSPSFNFLCLIAPESREQIKSVYERHVKNGKDIDPLEYRLVTKDGRILDAIMASTLIMYEGDNAILGTVTDITERKKAEETLRESEEKYRSIVENSADVVMLTLPDGIISYMSPSCFSVLGYDPEDLVGKQPAIFHPDDLENVSKTLSSALNGERGSDFEYRVITKSGETRWISHSWSPIIENG